MTWVDDVRQFYMEKRGSLPDEDTSSDLVAEEYDEWCWEDSDIPTADAKETIDLIYVLIGYGLACGYDMDEAWRRVHASNMTKQRTEDGKIQKGPDYVAPDMTEALS